MYIDKKNMKKLSDAWKQITEVGYAKDMNQQRGQLFGALELFGEVLRQATKDNETHKQRAVAKITEERKHNKRYARKRG